MSTLRSGVTDQFASLREKIAPVFEDESPDNVLDRLSVGNDERPHTHILEWLLDPSAGEEHGGEAAFQRSFAEQIDVQLDQPSVDTFRGRLGEENAEIDLVINDRDVCVGVEIKTTHTAAVSQLEREHRALHNEFQGYETYRLVYLAHDPDDEPPVGFDDYRRLTWAKVVDGFDVDAADPEWNGFLTHLFDHIKTTVMKREIESIQDMSDAAEKAAFYVHTLDFIDEAEGAYWDVLQQFFKDIAGEADELVQPQWMPDADDPWAKYDWFYRKNTDNDLDYSRVNFKKLSIYTEQWPSAVLGDDGDLNVRFQIIKRDHDSGSSSTAQTEGELTSEFGIEVNFDIYSNDNLKVQDEARERFQEEIDEEFQEELYGRGYGIDFSHDATYHVFGRLFETSWPPDQSDIDTVIDEFGWLVEAVHEHATAMLQDLGYYDYVEPEFDD